MTVKARAAARLTTPCVWAQYRARRIMAHSDDQIMLTLAGLTYRGFQDFLPGDAHEAVVRTAVLDGLQTLAPVRSEWELVWGPVTSRVPIWRRRT
jgi:hypothetical protein